MEVTVNNNTSKRHFDGNVVGKDFVSFYYTNLCGDVGMIENAKLIKEYTKFLFNTIVFEGNNIMTVLRCMNESNVTVHDCSCEVLDSGSRLIYILVTGKMINKNAENSFSQTFTINYLGEKEQNKWAIVNSILIMK